MPQVAQDSFWSSCLYLHSSSVTNACYHTHVCICAGVLRQCTCVFLQVCWGGTPVYIHQVCWSSTHVCFGRCVGWCTCVLVQMFWVSAHVCLCRCIGMVHICDCAGGLGQCTCVFVQVCWGSAHVYLSRCVGQCTCICISVLGAVHMCTYTGIWRQCTCVFVQVYLGGTLVWLCRCVRVVHMHVCEYEGERSTMGVFLNLTL